MTQDLSQSRLTQALAWTAAALFTASWFLPVLEDVPGWMAFRYALAPLDGHDAASLLKRADAAMYAGKQAGKHTLRRGQASVGLVSA